jgi:hypothetical protein
VSPQVAERIAEALGVPVSFLYLLGDHSDDPLVTSLKELVLRNLRKEKEIEADVDDPKESNKGHYIREYQPV